MASLLGAEAVHQGQRHMTSRSWRASRQLFVFTSVLLLSGVACVASRGVGTQPTPASIGTTSAPPPISATAQAPQPVPAEYQPLYDLLASELSAFEARLGQAGEPVRGQTVFAAELSYANGNIGEALLTPQVMQSNRVLLDRLQAMGIKGVVVAIKYPLLRPDFPRSAEYLSFFQQIVAEAHQRGLTVLVEAGAIFAGTAYSPVHVDWSKETTGSFLQGLQDQLLLIASQVKPDYLTLANEPTTEEQLTRLSITPAAWGEFVRATADKVDRATHILVGAGSGTWEDPAYLDQLMTMPGLDYIDLHIYPLGRDGNLIARALDVGRQARASGKRLTVSECWLYKTTPEEMSAGMGNLELIQNRDVFGFWSPLEERYLGDIVRLAEVTSMDFVSPFWTRNFFATLDYSSTPRGLSTAELNRRLNQAAMLAVENGSLTPLGSDYADLIRARQP